MNRKIAAALLAAGIAGGGAVANTTAAFADDTTQSSNNSRGGWITSAIKPLVDNGTINQTQSDAVANAVESARPEGPDGRGRGARPDFTQVASLFGMSADEFHAATREANKSIATLAKEKNVDLQKVIDALVTAQNTRIDEDVKSGKLTQAQADEMKKDAVTRTTEMVNETRPSRGSRDGNGGPGRFGGGNGMRNGSDQNQQNTQSDTNQAPTDANASTTTTAPAAS